MRDCLRVCYRYQVPAWSYDDKGIGAKLVEDGVLVGPSPVWDSEPVGLVSAVYYNVVLLAMRVRDDTYSVQVVHELGKIFLMMGNQSTCVVSQNLLKVYTGMQMYGKPDFFAAARLMAKHR